MFYRGVRGRRRRSGAAYRPDAESMAKMDSGRSLRRGSRPSGVFHSGRERNSLRTHRDSFGGAGSHPRQYCLSFRLHGSTFRSTPILALLFHHINFVHGLSVRFGTNLAEQRLILKVSFNNTAVNKHRKKLPGIIRIQFFQPIRFVVLPNYFLIVRFFSKSRSFRQGTYPWLKMSILGGSMSGRYTPDNENAPSAFVSVSIVLYTV